MNYASSDKTVRDVVQLLTKQLLIDVRLNPEGPCRMEDVGVMLAVFQDVLSSVMPRAHMIMTDDEWRRAGCPRGGSLEYMQKSVAK